MDNERKMIEVELEEASRKLGQLITRATSGEEIVITQAGKAIVRLVALEEIESESSRVAAMRLWKEEEEVDNCLMEEMLSAYKEEIN